MYRNKIKKWTTATRGCCHTGHMRFNDSWVVLNAFTDNLLWSRTHIYDISSVKLNCDRNVIMFDLL